MNRCLCSGRCGIWRQGGYKNDGWVTDTSGASCLSTACQIASCPCTSCQVTSCLSTACQISYEWLQGQVGFLELSLKKRHVLSALCPARFSHSCTQRYCWNFLLRSLNSKLTASIPFLTEIELFSGSSSNCH